MDEIMTKREIILDMLRGGPRTSWQLCEGAKTARYGGRIFELRAMGYVIEITPAITVVGDKKVQQKIYTLISEPRAIIIAAPEAILAERQMEFLGDGGELI